MSKLVFFVVCIFMLSCGKKASNTPNSIANYKAGKPNTQIAGRVENAPNNFIVLVKDAFRDTVFYDSQHQFEFNLNVSQATYFKVSDGKSNFRIFVEPSNKLYITFNSNSIFKTIKFTGKGAMANNYMRDKYLLQFNYAMPLEQLYQKPVPEFRHWVDSIYVINKLYFDAFVAKNENLSDVFKETEWAAIIYDRAAQLLEYLNAASQVGAIDEAKYLAFLNQLSVNNSNLLDVYEYKLFLNAFIDFYAGKQIQQRERAPHEITLVKLQTIIEKIDNQAVKDNLLFTVTSDHVRFYGYKNARLLFEIFERNCKNEKMREGLLVPYYEYVKLSQKQPAPQIAMVSANGNETSITQFKGSYIYIDVWATWCMPCRKEKPYFDALKTQYKHKNIEFICISIDKNLNDWKEFIANEGGTENQFLSTDIQGFTEAYLIKTVPRFILIDDKGNLINSDAPRPSDKNTQYLDTLPNKVGV